MVASGIDPRSRRLNLGHFAGRWQLTSPDQPTDRPEVLASGEGLHRGPVDVLGTLLHKAGRHSDRLVVPANPGAVLPSTAMTVERGYFLGLDIYSNKPIPAAAGPA